jgi:lysophospholipase L1-like esterase
VTRLALLGDSIAWGQGAARPEDRLAARLVRGLGADGIEATVQVYAVPGARSAGLAGQVERAVTWRPEVSVLVIGANDLTHLVPVDQAVADFRDAVHRLREARSEVVVAPAPDLSAVPHVPPPMRPLVRVASEELRRRQVEAATALGAEVADADGATSRAFGTDPRLFAADRFHPSSAGYAVIAASLLPAVRRAVGRSGGGPDHQTLGLGTSR